MYRLGLHLSLRSGREPFVRLMVTAVAVAIGVAIMLAVLADFHAFQTTNSRPSWETTQGQPVGRDYASAARAELWNYSNDIYQGQTIERLDVAGLGTGAPVPPGISTLPASGQYYASPALAALIRSAPASELGDRFPGRLAGTIGQQALTGPTELVIYVGYAPAKLAGLPATTVVNRIATAAGQQIWSHYFRDAFVVAAIAFLFPILILVGTATRLAAARREERYAALRLVGATMDQVGVISSVDAVVSAMLGAILGIVIFRLLQPALADTAITSARYFSDQVTPTAVGYLVVLIGVPAASAISSLFSLQRVRISPLGVSRRVRVPLPTTWRIVPLLVGIVLFVLGLLGTNKQSIGAPAFPGLIVILIGLMVAGPLLTARAARFFGRFMTGASSLLAARRLADNPKAAFRSVRGLVLAVFLGTIVAGLLPAIESVSATPSAQVLSNVLLDGFTSAPVCGNNVNCTGNSGPGHTQAGATALQQRIALAGLPPPDAAALLRGLGAFRGATAIPVYSLPQAADLGSSGPGGPSGPGGGFNGNAVMSCAGLRELAVLGQCAPGRVAVQVPAGNLFDDNPHYSTQPIASAASPAYAGNVGRLYLQALLVKVNSPATLERVRTYLVTHTPLSASGTAPRTFGEAVQARQGVAETVQRLVYIAVALTLIVAGCSLAVAVGGGLVERKRPFTLLRLTGTPTSTLYRVVFLEAILPLVAATVIAAGTAYGISVLTVSKLAPAGTPVPVPGHAYFLTMGVGLVASLLVILASLPLLNRITGPGNIRFE
ncbi:MAG TPA: FtsX-like permease family protein [Streptosporangiaceae bacterium]|nr:FtsX-like permease family protein [Streptosporangiaceae bacterium]